MRAVLVGVDFGKLDFVSSLEELALLSKTAGAQPVAVHSESAASRSFEGRQVRLGDNAFQAAAYRIFIHLKSCKS